MSTADGTPRIANFPPARAFLVSVVRAVISGTDAVATNDEIDWQAVADEAHYHGVVPQLWQFIEQGGSNAVPADVRDSLRQYFQNNLRRNLGLTGELWQLLQLFKSQGIQAVPFKGPTLAMAAYGDLARREFTDLDILVDGRDLVRVAEWLVAAGYKPRVDVSLLGDPVFTSLEREFYFTGTRTGTLIDLQWHLSSGILPFDLSVEDLCKDPMIVRPGGKGVATFKLESLLLYLCAHGSRHRWERLGWIADVAGLINRHPQLNWDDLLAQARAQKCERVLLHSLLLARDLTGAQLPPRVEQLAQADVVCHHLADSIKQSLAQPPGESINKTGLHQYFLKLQPRPSDQLRHLLRMAFAPTVIDWEFWRLPKALMFLYPTVRLIRVIAECLPFYRTYKHSSPVSH